MISSVETENEKVQKYTRDRVKILSHKFITIK